MAVSLVYTTTAHRSLHMPSPSVPFRFTKLPLELQREVFLMSGREDTRSAIGLALVSQQVHNWITPLIYRMVTLGSADTALFLRTLSSKPATFFAAHVKSLCLSVSVKPVEAEKILSVCSGVKNLAFWVDYLSKVPKSSMTRLISSLRLCSLSIEAAHFSTLCQSTFKSPSEVTTSWYTNLTHLDIIFWPRDHAQRLSDLSRLSTLTHVGLWHPHGFVDESIISRVLDSCGQLKILLVVVHEDDTAFHPPFQDRRVVLMPYPATIIQDWEASFIGRANTWSRAQEVFLAKADP